MAKRSRKGHYVGSYMKNNKRDLAPLSETQKGFLDNVLDMYISPNYIDLVSVRNGRSGFIQDKNRIRSYFQKAESKIGA